MKRIAVFSLALMFPILGSAQKINFEEYDLPNGLHVILHQDNSVPVVTTSVMYNVGSKNENPNQTGFAHFFEHLLFEGTKNIQRGKWDQLVAENGGTGNANTSADRTYYFQTFPSSAEQLSLWMESERLRQPIINQIGVDTQRSVIKEEKKMNMDNQPYGNIFTAVQQHLFPKSSYNWSTIGSMDHLDTATLQNFQDFSKKYYVPNNATLVVAGNIQPEETKKWINAYFGSIPRGADVVQPTIQEDPITKAQEFSATDPNIEIPAYIYTYRTPSRADKDSYALDFIADYLSGGNSSVIKRKLIDTGKVMEANASSQGFESQGMFMFLAMPMPGVTKMEVEKDFDAEIKKTANRFNFGKRLSKIAK